MTFSGTRRHAAGSRSTPPVAVVVLALLAGGLAVVALAASVTRPRTEASVSLRAGAVPAVAVAAPPVRPGSPRSVLRQWDARRARAWARGDVVGLRALYVAGSGAGRADVAMLQEWRSRGLRVTGLHLQVLALRPLVRRSHRLVLRVTDQEVGATARGRGSVTSLPHDRPSTRRLELRRSRDGPWRMVSVVDV